MTNPVHGIAVGALVELLTKAAAQPICLASSEDIMRMAQEAGFQFPNDYYLIEPTNRLKRFAALVAAAEREACAQILDHNANACANNSVLRDVLQGNATAIRARSNT